MTLIIKPPFLKKNDTIGIVSTARKLQEEDINKALEIFRSWGLKVKTGKYLFNAHHQFAGTDAERLEDIQSMIDDAEIKAIICARGGYGSTRIIDKINFYKLFEKPKWIAGFSDVTAILSQLHNLGIESIHSTMPLLFNLEGNEEALESLRKILFGEEYRITTNPHPLNKAGNASAVMVGGNLSIIAHLIGTGSDVDTQGKILFLEDLDEYYYHIDRMMIQLKRSGKLHALAGLVVGQMTDMKDNSIPFGLSAYEIILEHTKDFNYPIAFDFPIGHVAKNLAIPVTRLAHFEVTNQGSVLSFN